MVVNVETLKNDFPLALEITEKPETQSILSSVIPFKYHGMPGYIQLVNKTIGIMLSQLADLTMEKYHPDLVININRDYFGTYDFHKYDEIMEIGKLHACFYLDQFEKKELS